MKENTLKTEPVCIGIFLCLLSLHPVVLFAQSADLLRTEFIAVAGRPSQDSIMLRWAPVSFKDWLLANREGYRVERYVIARNGKLLSQPEKIILASDLRPWPEVRWERLVNDDARAAIAAQALYGDRFEVDLKQTDVFTIVNKVQENQQRFTFALFMADMSPQVARASGLWLSDTAVEKGEKYLYRVSINGADSLRGSIFISPDDEYLLPEPTNPDAKFNDRLVSLKWDRAASNPYTAYKVERSEDGIHFQNISDIPLVTVAPDQNSDTQFEYATDSLPDTSQKYYYRIRGLTPFGEEGPPSETVSGTSIAAVESVPYIVAAESINNSSILIQWDFSEVSQSAIEGFSVERSPQPSGEFAMITDKLLPPATRTYEDRHPGAVNYYRVRAKGLDKAWYGSHSYFAQLVDSIPPATPSRLKGEISHNGNVVLSWQPNIEKDIGGYRIYRSNTRDEEPAQLTIEPVLTPVFNDSVNLRTLNENIYYSVMAVDINQNHSALSDRLQLKLPDLIKPQPPVFLPVRSEADGVSLKWLAGGSEDIVQYRLFRKTPDSDWKQLRLITAASDSVFSYFDDGAERGKVNHYTIISVDDGGLESDPAIPVEGIVARHFLHPAVTWKKPNVNREDNQITLSWKHEATPVATFRIFRSTGTTPPVLYKTLPGSEDEYTDTVIPGAIYKYRIMALFNDGQKSFLSDELEFEY